MINELNKHISYSVRTAACQSFKIFRFLVLIDGLSQAKNLLKSLPLIEEESVI